MPRPPRRLGFIPIALASIALGACGAASPLDARVAPERVAPPDAGQDGGPDDSGAAPGRLASIGVGVDFTCVLGEDKALSCFGKNTHGESTPPHGTFLALDVGMEHACAIDESHAITCWGSDVHSETKPPSGEFERVSAGAYHTCALRADGTIACFGANDYGESSPPAGTFRAVSAGGTSSCGVRTSGELACWGTYGRAALPAGARFVDVRVGWSTDMVCALDDTGHVTCFTDVPGPDGTEWARDGTFAALGSSHEPCGVRADGTVACWDRSHSSLLTPSVTGAIDVASDGWHACALLGDGRISCTGNDDDGACSQPTTVRIGQLAASDSHTCGVAEDGHVECFGLLEKLDAQSTLVPIGNAHAPDGDFRAVAVGVAHTCALASNGAVTCTGDDSFGQASPPAGTFIDVAASAQTTCGVRDDGAIDCWGAGGKLLAGAAPPGVYSRVVVNGTSACGLRRDGTLACWGETGAAITGVFTDVSIGSESVCAIRQSGEIACAPLYAIGGLGESPPSGTFRRVAVRDEGGGCAVRTDGTLACWGSSFAGASPLPTGAFADVVVSTRYACAARSEGGIVCFGDLARDRGWNFSARP